MDRRPERAVLFFLAEGSAGQQVVSDIDRQEWLSHLHR